MTILSAILGVETGGGRNITQGNIGDINNQRGTPAQGYFQITDPTWAQFGGLSTGYNSAINAPYSTQLDIARNIPVARWGGASQTALAAQGYYHQPGETLGQMMDRYGESNTDTVARDGSTYAGTQGQGVANGPGDAAPGDGFAPIGDTGFARVTGATDGSAGGPGYSQATAPDTAAPDLTDGSAGGAGYTQAGAPTSSPTTPSSSSPTTPGTQTTGTQTPGQGQGAPINLGLQAPTTQAIGGWVNQAITATGQGLQKTLTAAENSIATAFGGIANWFVRGLLIMIGIVVIVLALRSVTQPKGA